MPIITLTSEWKDSDFYIGAIKGSILKHCGDVRIIDISHQIRTFDIAQAAYIIRNGYKYFPKDTIHLIFVSGMVPSNRYIAVMADGHYFLATDNGIFDLIFAEGIEYRAVEITPEVQEAATTTFPEISMLVNAACKLSINFDINQLGNKVTDIAHQIPLMAVINEASITGKVVFIDSYGNAVCNVSNTLFERISKGRKFRITVKTRYNEIVTIHTAYHDVPTGDLFALFNSEGLLEIGINQGNAAELLNIDTDTYIRIVFINPN